MRGAYLGDVGVKLRTELNWLRIWASGWLLWTQYWTFEFPKWREISWLAEWLSHSQQGFSSMEFVNKQHMN